MKQRNNQKKNQNAQENLIHKKRIEDLNYFFTNASTEWTDFGIDYFFVQQKKNK